MIKNSKKAFSIVEVVLILAIAGLVFIMVFFALPAIRRTQHNSQRKDDLARFMSAFNAYAENNGGELPFKTREIPGKMGNTSTLMWIPVKDFVVNYIDKECDIDGAWGNRYGDLVDINTSADVCSDAFRDPNGDLYVIVPDVKSADECDGPSNEKGVMCYPYDFKKDYANLGEIYVYRQYSCAEDEGVLIRAESARTIALMTKLEGGSIACVDNVSN